MDFENWKIGFVPDDHIIEKRTWIYTEWAIHIPSSMCVCLYVGWHGVWIIIIIIIVWCSSGFISIWTLSDFISRSTSKAAVNSFDLVAFGMFLWFWNFIFYLNSNRNKPAVAAIAARHFTFNIKICCCLDLSFCVESIERAQNEERVEYVHLLMNDDINAFKLMRIIILFFIFDGAVFDTKWAHCRMCPIMFLLLCPSSVSSF